MLKLLRITGFIEGVSYLVLLGICMPLKYLYNTPEPTTIVGMAHGLLFTLFIILTLVVSYQKKWKWMVCFWALLSSLLPFATFIADKKIFSRADDSRLKRN
jgi:integral membrane protein